MRSNGNYATPDTAAALPFPCPKCKQAFRTGGWLRWHYCRVHCDFKGVIAAAAAGDPDKYVKGAYSHMVRR